MITDIRDTDATVDQIFSSTVWLAREYGVTVDSSWKARITNAFMSGEHSGYDGVCEGVDLILAGLGGQYQHTRTIVSVYHALWDAVEGN